MSQSVCVGAWDVPVLRWFWCFFFQAEDGIRDTSVTGVQTYALPIYAIGQGPQITQVLPVAETDLYQVNSHRVGRKRAAACLPLPSFAAVSAIVLLGPEKAQGRNRQEFCADALDNAAAFTGQRMS